MRYAIISDIHSNLEALETVLKLIEKEHIDKIFCLGDVVGYGPFPNECLNLVKQNCEVILTGNHDFACIEKSELLYFNQFAKEAIEWTVTQLSDETLREIANLPLEHKGDNYCLVHSNPYAPSSWDYILSIDDAIFNFSKFNEQLCFIGHSHQPIIYIENRDANYSFTTDRELEIKEGHRYIINVGSVGQPRDNNPKSAFGIFDTQTRSYQLKRISYDIHKTYDAMRSFGLPEFLAERIFVGR
ncbi:MAG: metallophosphoesterase family protein [Candidatus Zhuqueibacterota bacterium]